MLPSALFHSERGLTRCSRHRPQRNDRSRSPIYQPTTKTLTIMNIITQFIGGIAFVAGAIAMGLGVAWFNRTKLTSENDKRWDRMEAQKDTEIHELRRIAYALEKHGGAN